MCFELSPTYFQLTKIAAPTFAISKASIYKFITEISPLNWCKSSFRIYLCVLNKCLHRLAKYSTHECLIMTKPRVESRFFAILPNKQNTKEKIFMCLLFEWLKVGASYSNRCEIRKFGNSDTKHLPMAKSELCASCGGCNELTVHSSHKSKTIHHSSCVAKIFWFTARRFIFTAPHLNEFKQQLTTGYFHIASKMYKQQKISQ